MRAGPAGAGRGVPRRAPLDRPCDLHPGPADLTLSPVEFGNKQKINNPQVECEDPEDAADPESCSVHVSRRAGAAGRRGSWAGGVGDAHAHLPVCPQRAECKRLLTAAAFEDCQGRVPLEPYLQACVQDLCLCGANASCACSTLSEFSRQCSHAGGRPGTWRTASFCGKPAGWRGAGAAGRGAQEWGRAGEERAQEWGGAGVGEPWSAAGAAVAGAGAGCWSREGWRGADA